MLPRELGIRHKQVMDALPFDEAPRYMIRYRDGAIGPDSLAEFAQWGFEVTLLRRGRRGRMGKLNN